MFLEKYHPKTFDDFIGNKVKVNKVRTWLKDFKTSANCACLISGNHGIGKSSFLDLLKKEFNLELIEYNQSDLKDIKNSENLDSFFPRITKFDEIFFEICQKKVIIFNEIESITIPSEKNFIIKILKKNHKERIVPIILINNGKHSKLLNDIKKMLLTTTFLTPSVLEIKPLIKKICNKENIKLESKYFKGLINFCKCDIRKVVLTLQDLKDIFKSKEIGKEELRKFYENNNAKQEEIGLYSSVSNLLNRDYPFEKTLTLYQMEKILLSLTLLENIPLKVSNIDDYCEILKSYSDGDIIETSIYADQNWFLRDLHAFDTCIYPNFLINKNNTEKTRVIDESELIFTNDLSRTSLKNINKKNIEEIKSLIPDISLNEIINLSYLLTQCIKLKKKDLIKDLKISARLIELIVKINKFEYDSSKMSKKKL